MPADNALQLVIQVEADKANHSIKSVNASLSSLESTAVSAARGASRGVDGLTASIAKGAAAGTLLAHAFEKVPGCGTHMAFCEPSQKACYVYR